MAVLLTIAVPTYNRRDYVSRLLEVLIAATHDVEREVEIVVSDNASDDGTAAILSDLSSRAPRLRVMRNPVNIGADANITQCFRTAAGRHVWIMGDDDMPKPGAIPAVLDMLRTCDPDLVYVPSEWLPDVRDPNQGTPVRSFDFVRHDRVGFARHVNVWLTFLSGMIVRKSHGATGDLGDLTDTNLIQLGWILPALRDGQCLIAFEERLVLATGGNTGGYAVIRVFGVNLSAIVARAFGRGSAVYRAILAPTVASYLPQLIWNVRTGAGGRFDGVFPWREMRTEIGNFVSYWSFVVPVGRAPAAVARGALLASRLATKARAVIAR